MVMEGRLNLRRKDREALREEFFRRAGVAFERMFAEGNQDQLVTFIEREGLACALGKEVAAFLFRMGGANGSRNLDLSRASTTCV
jgi:hypothetical protein